MFTSRFDKLLEYQDHMPLTVCVIGAAGGIGQPLSLLLKQNLPFGSKLRLYDLAGTAGVAADLSHVDSEVDIEWANGSLPPKQEDPELQRIAQGVDIFVIVAGVPRKPGMTRDDLFKVNAGICLDVVLTVARVSPKAAFCVITNPVNSTVPIASQALKKLGVYDRNKLFGVTSLDGMRATRFVNQAREGGVVVPCVPVVGGHSDTTIVPLLSQLPGSVNDSGFIANRVQVAGTEVVKAKAGKGSATLSMAAAGARFTLSLVDALLGNSRPVVYTYVDTSEEAGTYEKLPFFACPVVLGKTGIVQRLPIGTISTAEQKLLKVACTGIQDNIAKGEAFARSKL